MIAGSGEAAQVEGLAGGGAPAMEVAAVETGGAVQARRFPFDDVGSADLGGWRRQRMPVMTTELPYFDLAPDGVCEVLSGSTKE